MFIKRFYLTLLEHYFDRASFAKPTGDGLLLIFRYSERDLPQVAEYVLTACLRAMDDFPAMFDGDPMVNFLTPTDLGFGISRGPTCCIFSGRTVVDYSGQLLNLAARLNDYARPRGIVLDGQFQMGVIPASLRHRFAQSDVYIRGIAEDTPRRVLCLTPEVRLPAHANIPISSDEWVSVEQSFLVGDLKKVPANFVLRLAREPLGKQDSRLEFVYTNPKFESTYIAHRLQAYELGKDAKGHTLTFNLGSAREEADKAGLARTKQVKFLFQYIARPVSPAPEAPTG